MGVYILIALVIQIAILLTIRKNRNDLKTLSLTLTAGMSLSIAVLVWPYFSAKYADPMISLIKSVRYGAGTIGLNIDPDIFDFIDETEPLRRIYVIFLYYLHIAGPATASLFAVSFSRAVSEWIHYRGHSRIHVFSELNSRTVAIAESISEMDPDQMLMFRNVTDSSPEDLKIRARAVHSILMSRDEREIILERGKNYEFYEIGQDIREQLLRTADLCGQLIKKRNYSMDKVIVRFSASDEYIDLIRNLNNSYGDKVRLRHINEADSEAVGLLRNYSSILSTAGHHDIIIIGGGATGVSILKTTLGVMFQPGSTFTIYFISDRARKEASYLKASSPEVLNLPLDRYFSDNAEGKNYDIRFFETDINGSGLTDVLESVDSPDLVCISGGNDEQNYRLTESVKRFYAARHEDLSYPHIACCVRDKSINDTLGKEDGILFFGNESERYGYGYVINSELEDIARRVHLSYLSSTAPDALDASSEEQERLLSESGFYGYSNFQSSIANALTLEYRRAFILSTRAADDGTPDETYIRQWLSDPVNLAALGDSEHLRWNAYQRIQGWRTASPAQTGKIAEMTKGRRIKSDDLLLHPALVGLNELPSVEENTDMIKQSFDPESSPTRFVDLDRDIMMKLPDILNIK